MNVPIVHIMISTDERSWADAIAKALSDKLREIDLGPGMADVRFSLSFER